MTSEWAKKLCWGLTSMRGNRGERRWKGWNKEKVTAYPQGILQVYCYCQPAEQLKFACEAGCFCVYHLRQLQELVGRQQGGVCLCTPLDQWAGSSVSDITSLHLTYLKVAVTSLLSLSLRCFFFPLSSSTLSYTTPVPLASFFLSHLPDFPSPRFFFSLFFVYAESHTHTHTGMEIKVERAAESERSE